MKPRSHHPVKAAKRPSKRPAKKAAKRARTLRGDEVVALAVGRALTRKPKVNQWLLRAFEANRDLFAL